MKSLIETLKRSLQQEGDLLSVLEHADANCWQADYPVAVVHEERRVKETECVTALKEHHLLDSHGLSPQLWNAQKIDLLKTLAPKYLKKVSMLVHKGNAHDHFMFQEKRAQDYWKKVVDDGSFEAVVEHSVYAEDAELCSIESDLRDLMRSSKEVPALKEIGFIWLVEAPLHLEMDRILAHYYQKNWKMVIAGQKTVYIGWHNRLGSVDMRHFVCPPNTNKREK
ncbi:MAG TPA: hypothetical protein EYG78_07390 [Sulfurovum sp.]|nr:hypothetical protein [Sulfurovum sp.]